jgi:uncharacterized protein YgiM (DUF1202 family)
MKACYNLAREGGAAMAKYKSKTLVYALNLLFLVALHACQSKESPKPQELPELTGQIRPYVTTENTRVRTGPGPQFRPIAEIKRDAKVQVVGRQGEWVLIVSKVGNPPGYIEIAAVKPGGEGEPETPPSPVEGKYETVADTQVRSGPALHYPPVAKIKKGTKINVVNEENGWLKVESKRGNQPGYVDASLAKPMATR